METEKYRHSSDTRLHIHKIYEEDGAENTETFGVRTCSLHFTFLWHFVLMDNQDIDIAQVSTDQIVSAVEEETQVQDVWMDLVESVR